MKHLNVTIRGKVQGVYFRMTTKSVADVLGVKGFILNQRDGSVYMEAEADAFGLDSLLDFCKEGPEDAEVESIDVEEGEMKGFKDFAVIKRIKS